MTLHRRRLLAASLFASFAVPGRAEAAGHRKPGGPAQGPGGRGRAGGAGRRDADLAALARGLDGRLVLPGDPDYPAAKRLYQPRHDGTAPSAVAYPAHEADVAACLDFARRQGLPVVPRSGGHSYPGWSTGPGLVLDVGALARVTPGAGSARIGAGARLADVHARLGAVGAALPTGLCPSVGIAGLTLGGGLGVSGRAYGATCDRLTGARIVTPDGVVRDVDAGHEPDLFWALRGGGGGNFGVVTEFRFRTHAMADCAFAELNWAWRDAKALVLGWRRWLAELPDPYWSQVELYGAGPDGSTPGPAVRVVCLDGAGETERLLDRLEALAGSEPRDRHFVVRGYEETMRVMAGCGERTVPQCHLPGGLPGQDPRGSLERETYAARSDFWRAGGLSEAAVDVLLDAVAGYPAAVPPGGRGVVQLDGVCGGALNRVAVGDTAFVHRGEELLAQYLALWPGSATPAEVARHEGWLRELWSRLRPWASGRAYQNYADPWLPDWRGAYYGPALPRLEEVRRRYDPDRLFRFPHAV
ncbi:FAD-binding oxidoreductase [Streptomyces sp. NPDC086023]|uniref:FAD-binding oxidoreductase n=1 Tax=Streptomyces sp. NPDC086023 TaxID=3365746 RepID=UPI0037D33D28